LSDAYLELDRGPTRQRFQLSADEVAPDEILQ